MNEEPLWELGEDRHAPAPEIQSRLEIARREFYSGPLRGPPAKCPWGPGIALL